ncbi:hypothetical protein [Cytophaga hutchinsonii]|jgi:hypothetical protein|uniref:Uncharacterized protein n=1 Tax=Cytophaga hutchinsonii (strain ATCC 33406 / DSM 1761 / CIP 103989 / NBRC 15051 / NCIMB 9469 / D465) TaxID=269798 RepID=A0A6N4STR3_CYTH3|nr:hypothetical protein [Cytophaga hutchinsonii]ABG59773.1 hypothetical protein CHU_2519 [Cytophaga hutchinsonii ATCC 33406]SFX64400.1 hypothetical protein SAMN04487930_10711 [Cytophaga hutchinsonii ATCC 33406]
MELNINTIRALAQDNMLASTIKLEDSFIVNENDKTEIEAFLRNAKIGYQCITQSGDNVLFIIQPYGEQG